MSQRLKELESEFDGEAMSFEESRRLRREQLQARMRKQALMDASIRAEEKVVLGDVKKMQERSRSGSNVSSRSSVQTKYTSYSSTTSTVSQTRASPSRSTVGTQQTQPTSPMKRNTSDEHLESLSGQRSRIQQEANKVVDKARRSSETIEQDKIIMEANVTITTQKMKTLSRITQQRRESRESFTTMLEKRASSNESVLHAKNDSFPSPSTSASFTTADEHSMKRKVTFADNLVEEQIFEDRTPLSSRNASFVDAEDIDNIMASISAEDQSLLADMLGIDDGDDVTSKSTTIASKVKSNEDEDEDGDVVVGKRAADVKQVDLRSTLTNTVANPIAQVNEEPSTWREEVQSKKLEKKQKKIQHNKQLNAAVEEIENPEERARAKRAIKRKEQLRNGETKKYSAFQPISSETSSERQKKVVPTTIVTEEVSTHYSSNRCNNGDDDDDFDLDDDELQLLESQLDQNPDLIDDLDEEGGDVKAIKEVSNITRGATLSPAIVASRASTTSSPSLAFLINQDILHTIEECLRPVNDPKATRSKVLYKVKGKAAPRVTVVSRQHMDSLCASDTYVLDAVDKILVFNGSSSTRLERAGAQAFSISIKDNEYSGRISLQQATSDDMEMVLDGSASDIAPPNADEDPQVYEDSYFKQCYLFDIASAMEGDGKPEHIATGRKITRDHLDRTRAYLLVAPHEGFVWIGGRADRAKRKTYQLVGSNLFRAMCGEKGWDTSSAFFFVEKDGFETALFRTKFRSWDRGNNIGVAQARNPVPLESQAFRARALTAAGNIANNIRSSVPEKNAKLLSRDKRTKFFSFQELKQMVQSSTLPEDIDPKAPEDALSDVDFVDVFEMSPRDFALLPQWKRQNISKSTFQ
eukprot:m.23345 g.23345  ORF g.23345 m.23345 type:complete len:868 (-) comp5538_c0_seq4:127-2730(-)